jgi:hypothetical protein
MGYSIFVNLEILFIVKPFLAVFALARPDVHVDEVEVNGHVLQGRVQLVTGRAFV